eukprot:15366514-Ditylum_brightwellii.AAC.1
MFKSRAPTYKEVAELQKAYTTVPDWDPTSNSIYMYGQSQKAMETRLIHALSANHVAYPEARQTPSYCTSAQCMMRGIFSTI